MSITKDKDRLEKKGSERNKKERQRRIEKEDTKCHPSTNTSKRALKVYTLLSY